MKYYSTNGKASLASLQTAVVQGLAPDRGLYMPERIETLPAAFFSTIQNLTLHEIACRVACAFFGDDVPHDKLDGIVCDTLSFPIPLVEVKPGIHALELFHGPTLAFKDVGARFMARMLRYFNRNDEVHVLVATSGDTGSAVANGFLGVEGIKVHVLYPKGKVSFIQECQFTTLGQNITALEVEGTFDDCQALVKSAFMDAELNRRLSLTSANSINVARFLPQAFYYFHAYAQLRCNVGKEANVVCCVPSGNFGNLCAGLVAKRMGLPVMRFIAANNRNDVFHTYLQTGQYDPRPSVPTMANAMDVGAPSNFARILDLYSGSHEAICRDISGATVNDREIGNEMLSCHKETGYQLDPHGACGYHALTNGIRKGEIGFFLETAHPAKFIHTVKEFTPPECNPIEIPERLQAFAKGRKRSVPMTAHFPDFRRYLLSL